MRVHSNLVLLGKRKRVDFGKAHNEITAMSDDEEEMSSGVEDLVSPDDDDDADDADGDRAALALQRATAENLPLAPGEWQVARGV